MVSLILILAMSTLWTPESVIKDYILKQYPWPDVEVQNVTVEGKLPQRRPSQIITERGPIGRASFVLLFGDGHSVRVRAKVIARDWVLRSIRPLARGTILSDEDLYPALMDVSRIPKGAVKSLEQVRGMMLKRSLRADSVITEAVIKKSPLVKKGQKVVILFRSRGLKITATGIARQSGSKGEYVTVMNLSSKRYIKGVITDKGVVNVAP